MTSAKLKKIKLIISDVDGVITDGRIHLLGDKEIKVFSVRDASPIEMALRAGLKFLLFTSRKSDSIIKRAQELNVDLAFKGDVKAQGGDLPAFVKERYGVTPEEVLYVGDDWSDLHSMTLFGLSATPGDGAPENKAIATIVTSAKAGEGVLREVIEMVMKAQETWDKFLVEYHNSLSV